MSQFNFYNTNILTLLDKEDVQTVTNSGAWQRAVESMWYRQGGTCLSELIDRLSKIDEFQDELSEFDKQDFVEPAEESDACLVQGQSWFHFNWSDLSTVEVDSYESMIDFKKWVSDKGLPVENWFFDEDGQLQRHDAVEVTDAVRGERVEAFWKGVDEHACDGSDVDESLRTVAETENPELAEFMKKSGAEKVYGDYVNDSFNPLRDGFDTKEEAAEDFCNQNRIDGEYPEIYEHWNVGSWLKDKLEERGAPVAEVAGLDVWGRTTTGQSISLDGVMNDIFRQELPSHVAEVVETAFPEIYAKAEAALGEKNKAYEAEKAASKANSGPENAQ